MPLEKDEKGGAREKDGSLRQLYCRSCYHAGDFQTQTMTLREIQKLVDDVLKNEMGWWKIFRWLAVKQIPKLARWKTN